MLSSNADLQSSPFAQSRVFDVIEVVFQRGTVAAGGGGVVGVALPVLPAGSTIRGMTSETNINHH
jgi:hypothetical protein